MNKLSGNEIRNTWINFFKSKQHEVIPSASLVPSKEDKSLLWNNAGVTPLKKYFDGSEIPPSRRLTNVQKCIRTNDIENVGDERHLTFFEMLGNFSIGDYFKKEAIPFAFELLTSPKYFGIEKEKLYMTYNPMDSEAKKLWMEQGVEESHLIPLETNFWEIGEGPCGPDTEIFFDRGEDFDPEHIGVKLLQDEIDNTRYLEIWNLVFSQYQSETGKKRSEYKELPNKNIDTGAGLERFALVLQGVNSNFETDLFAPIIHSIESLCNKKYETNKVAFRIIADHIRTITFSLNDGAEFSNEGRGYVVRRLLRRALNYGRELNLNEPFMHKLCDVIFDNYSQFYELHDLEKIKQNIFHEEERFIYTLKEGRTRLDDLLKKSKNISGEDAFKLYDTYGFPFELTKEIVLKAKGKIDEEGFNKCMEDAKELARSSRKNVESFGKQNPELIAFKTKSEFLYDTYKTKSKVIAIFDDGKSVKESKKECELIFDKTPFYCLSGGQISDKGYIYSTEYKCEVLSLYKAPNKQNVHVVKPLFGSIKVGDEMTLEIDSTFRDSVKRNHSATHLLDETLNRVLKENIEQKGSSVTNENLHFDFNYHQKLSDVQLQTIENKINELIYQEIEGKTDILPIEEAKKVGAKMLFDEKYGDFVRVVSFGDYSKEFCGGTHCKNTSEIGAFAILSEESVAAGTRRITALTGENAVKYLMNNTNVLKQSALKIKENSINNFSNQFDKFLAKNKKESEDADLLSNDLINRVCSLYKENVIKVKDDLNLIVADFNYLGKDQTFKVINALNSPSNNQIKIIVNKTNDSTQVLFNVEKNALNKVKGNDLFAKVKDKYKLNGGGRPDMVFTSTKETINTNALKEDILKALQ